MAEESGAALPIDLLQMMLSDELASSGVETALTLTELMYELAIEELMEYVQHQVSKTRLHFKAITATRTTLRPLLASHSISEIFGFIWKAVKNSEKALDSGKTQGATHGGNLIPSKLNQAADDFEVRPPDYVHPDFFRLPQLKICELSNTLYELILQDYDGAFKVSLPRYINEIMRPTLEGITSAKTAKIYLE